MLDLDGIVAAFAILLFLGCAVLWGVIGFAVEARRPRSAPRSWPFGVMVFVGAAGICWALTGFKQSSGRRAADAIAGALVLIAPIVAIVVTRRARRQSS